MHFWWYIFASFENSKNQTTVEVLAYPLRPLKGMDFYVSLLCPLRNVVIVPQFLIHTSGRNELALCLGLLDNVSISTHIFYPQKLINLFWQKHVRNLLNGPDVTRPVCKTLTHKFLWIAHYRCTPWTYMWAFVGP